MWLALTLSLSVTTPHASLFEQRSAWVRESMLKFRLIDDFDVRTFSNVDVLSRASMRSFDARVVEPAYSFIGIGVFAALVVLIAHGPEGVRTSHFGPATLPDGALGSGWAIRF